MQADDHAAPCPRRGVALAARGLACTLVLALLAPAGAGAAEPDAAVTELELFNLEEALEVTVTSASMSEERIETTPSTVSVLTGDQLRALGLRRLSDALQLLAGVTVLDGQLNERQVAVRGIASPANILVTLDGVRLNSFYDGEFPADLSLEDIERIEVIRGPGSALYGTNAFSGVIALFSTRGAQSLTVGADFEATADDAMGYGSAEYLRWSGALGAWKVGVFGSWQDHGGPKVRVERDNSLGEAHSPLPAQTNAGRRAGDATLRLEREALLAQGDHLELSGAALWRQRSPYFGLNRSFAPESQFQSLQALGSLGYSVPLPAGFKLSARGQFARQEADNALQVQPDGYFDDDNSNLGVDPGELFPDGKWRRYAYGAWRAGADAQLAHAWDGGADAWLRRNQLLLGVDFERDWLPEFEYGQNYQNDLYQGSRLENWDGLPLDQRGRDRTLLALFAQDQLSLAERVFLTAGLRWDRYSDFGSALSPRAALVVAVRKGLTAKLLYGRAFRAPLFRELYDRTGQAFTKSGLPIRGNEELAPEKTETFEGAVEWAPASFANLRGSVFQVRTSNLIDLDPTFNAAGTKLINYPGRLIRGAEGELQLFLDRDNFALLNASYFRSEQLGEGLPGWEKASDRRFLDEEMVDLPSLRVNVALVGRPLRSLEGALRRTRVGITYAHVSESANNKRTTFEALSAWQRPAWHEVRGSLGVPLAGEKLMLDATLSQSFGKTIPISLSDGWYELPAAQTRLFVGLRAQVP